MVNRVVEYLRGPTSSMLLACNRARPLQRWLWRLHSTSSRRPSSGKVDEGEMVSAATETPTRASPPRYEGGALVVDEDQQLSIWADQQRSFAQRDAEARVLGPGIDHMRHARSQPHRLVPFAARALLRGIDTSVLSIDTERDDAVKSGQRAMGNGWAGILRDPDWPVPNLFRLCSTLPLDGVGLKVRRNSANRQYIFQPYFLGFYDRRDPMYADALTKGQQAAQDWCARSERRRWPTDRSMQMAGRRVMAQYYDAHRRFACISPTWDYQEHRFAQWLVSRAAKSRSPPPTQFAARRRFLDKLLHSARYARRSAFRLQWQTFLLKHYLAGAHRLQLAQIPSKHRLHTELDAALQHGSRKVEQKIAVETLSLWAEGLAQSNLDRGLDRDLLAELGLSPAEREEVDELAQHEEEDRQDNDTEEEDAISQEDEDLQREELYAVGRSSLGSKAAEDATRTIAIMMGIPQATHKASKPAEQDEPLAVDQDRPPPSSRDSVYELDLPGAMVPERYFILTRMALRLHRHSHFRVADHYSGRAFGLDFRRSTFSPFIVTMHTADTYAQVPQGDGTQR